MGPGTPPHPRLPHSALAAKTRPPPINIGYGLAISGVEYPRFSMPCWNAIWLGGTETKSALSATSTHEVPYGILRRVFSM